MGLSSSKTKTKTDQTQTPVVSQPYDAAFKGFTGKIGDFLATDPHQYVAPASELQNKAFADAQHLGSYKPYLDAASASANAGTGAAAQSQAAKVGPVATYGGAKLGPASMISQTMGAYKDPYQQQVIDSAMSDYDQYAGQQRAMQQADAGKTAAFGGSRYGVAQGQLEGELARGRSSVESNLLHQGFLTAAQLGGQDTSAINSFLSQQANLTQGAGLANMDARNAASSQQANLSQQTNLANQAAQNEQYQRQLQAAALQAQLAQTASSSELAGLGATAALGGTQRDIASAYTNAVPTQLQMAGSLYSSLYPGIYAGQNTKGTSTSTSTQPWGPILAAAAGSAAQAAATGGMKF